MPPSLDQARAALAAQPFSRLLGAQLNRFGPDGVELEVPVRPEHRQQHGSPMVGCSAMRPTTP
jgi:acyl-coenzyme A thioesterase PaaI-like protein